MYGIFWSSDIFGTAFILAIVTNAEVAETNTTILALYQDICRHSGLFYDSCSIQISFKSLSPIILSFLTAMV